MTPTCARSYLIVSHTKLNVPPRKGGKPSPKTIPISPSSYTQNHQNMTLQTTPVMTLSLDIVERTKIS